MIYLLYGLYVNDGSLNQYHAAGDAQKWKVSNMSGGLLKSQGFFRLVTVQFKAWRLIIAVICIYLPVYPSSN